jgi:hypothetical protein
MPHHFDVLKTGMLKAVILVIKDKARIKIVTQKERI